MPEIHPYHPYGDPGILGQPGQVAPDQTTGIHTYPPIDWTGVAGPEVKMTLKEWTRVLARLHKLEGLLAGVLGDVQNAKTRSVIEKLLDEAFQEVEVEQ